ncbi:type II toxin-antitoxin system Phd/YefM family antitoxin [Rhodococcus chondri]|uniref:type II toxin-antitoxin system Phd/YefM family antitoxin n=1 Tax=Rhodococcus chondri TaxID=3065941 RepID=UPI002E7BE50F|nr:type II toxin-antitoxin system prevent-host-death family antitoxin [Rhodococcus sp. CC-R104]
MPSTTVKSARKRLSDLIREVNDDTVAVEIVGKRNSAMLISKARYAALQEATFLLRSPELMESLRREMERSRVETAQQSPSDDASAATAKTKLPQERRAFGFGKKERRKHKKRG